MRLAHRSCEFVSETRAYRKQRQGCISIVPVHSMKGALCNEKVFFLLRIDKSLWLRATQLERPPRFEKLVGRVSAGYGSQEEVFRDAVEQGIKVKCQTGCARHFYTKNSLLMIIHVYRIPFSEIILGIRRLQMLPLQKGSCAVWFRSLSRLYMVSLTSFRRHQHWQQREQ